MLILITGGSGSGKSELAENICLKLKKENLYYIATMKIYDKECEKRVEKHRNQRKDKGFETVEMPENIHNSASIMNIGATALLECIGNLMANEKFEEKSENPVKKIMSGIEILKNHLENLVIVSNEIFSDNDNYDYETLEYMKNVADINRQTADIADIVIEVCCGIPLIYKGENLYNEIFD